MNIVKRLLNAPRSWWAAWMGLAHFDQGLHMLRIVLATMFIVGGIGLLVAAPNVGVTRAMIENPFFVFATFADGRTLYLIFSVFTVVCGIGMLFYGRKNVKVFGLLSMPLLIYSGYGVVGVLTGVITNWSGVVWLVGCYFVVLILYYMLTGRGKNG